MSMVIRKINIIPVFLFILSLFSFFSCQKEVFVENKDNTVPELCKLSVTSNPPGAKIYIDQKFTGYTTPDTIKWLSNDQHKVTLKFSLIKDTSVIITPTTSEIKSVYIDYFAFPGNYGSISCQSNPSSAAIFINGINSNKSTPFVIPYLFPGIHNVKFRYPGCRDDSAAVTVYGGNASSLYLTLQDTSKWIDYRLNNSNIGSNKVVAMDVDRNNNIWVGTLDYGIARFSKGKFVRYTTTNSGLPYDFVTCIKVDDHNNIWVGTIQGLAKYNGVTWTVFKAGQSALPANYITSIYPSNDGNVWIGTEKGLARINGNNVYSYSSQVSPLLQNYISGITIDKSGKLWIASVGGISVLSNGNWNVFTRSSHWLVGFDAGAITADAAGNIWCSFPEIPTSGIPGGLMKFDGTNWREVNVPLIPKGRIQCMYSDASGNMWIGSAIGFLIIKPDNTQTVYKSANYAMWTYDVRGLSIDQENNAWIALFGGGIVKWKNPFN